MSWDLPFSQSGGALLFHMLSNRYEHAGLVIITNLSFSEWSIVFGDDKMITALLDRLTHHFHIVETGNESYRCNQHLSSPDKDQNTRTKEKGRKSRTMSHFDPHHKCHAACGGA